MMFTKRFNLFLCLSFCFSLEAAAQSSMTLEDAVSYFGQAPNFLSAELSPSGKNLSVYRMNDNHPQVQLYTLNKDGATPTKKFDFAPSLFNWHTWVNDTTILATTTKIDGSAYVLTGFKPKKESAPTGLTREFYTINTSNGDMRLLLSIPVSIGAANSSDSILNLLKDAPDTILVELALDGGEHPGVYKLNLKTGETTTVEAPQEPFSSWQSDLDGNIRLAYGWGDDEFEVKVRTTPESEWQSLTGAPIFKDGRFSISGFSDDGKSLYVRSSIGKGREAIYRFNMKRKAIRKKIFEHSVYDAGGLITNRGGDKILAATYVDDKLQFKIFDEGFKALRDRLSEKLPSMDFYTSDYSKEAGLWLVRASSTVTPPKLYSYHEETDTLTLLLNTMNAPAPAPLVEMKPVTYFSRDGLEINAYLTRPVNSTSAGPAIIMPHGGPWVRDSLGYDYWVQFFVSQGYSVLQPNFRGSTGYGNAFLYRGFSEWGKAMQTDLDDGAEWMVSKGYAQKDKICMIGGSYGGFAALSATTTNGFKYSCAVAYAPVSDINMWVNLISDSKAQLKGYRYRTAGEKTKHLKKASPLFNVKKVKTPLFIAHGDRDIRVAPAHSSRMIKVLAKRKKPVETLWLEGGSHFLLQQEHRKAFFKKTAEFIAKHVQ